MFTLTSAPTVVPNSSFARSLSSVADACTVSVRQGSQPNRNLPTGGIAAVVTTARHPRKLRERGKKAKTLSDADIDKIVTYIRERTHTPLSLEVTFLATVYAGLRIGEAATLTIDCFTDASGEIGNMLHVRAANTKSKRSRTIPVHPRLREAVLRLVKAYPDATRTAFTSSNGRRQRPQTVKAVTNMVQRIYHDGGFPGCSTHSGRRTFITNLARMANLYGASLRDVQLLAGHARLDTTESYIDPSSDVRSLVMALGSDTSPADHPGAGE